VAGNITIGVLALQGAVHEHLQIIESCGVRSVAIKKPSLLKGVDGLIIPGGESTTIGKLIDKYGFTEELRKFAGEGLPIFGTCAGLIVMAKRVKGRHGELLGLVDVTVERNAFGRQIDSFERDISIRDIAEDKPFRAIFIRAPVIVEVGGNVSVMAEVEEGVVLARERNLMVSAFHPELTGDLRIHKYFVGMVKEN